MTEQETALHALAAALFAAEIGGFAEAWEWTALDEAIKTLYRHLARAAIDHILHHPEALNGALMAGRMAALEAER